MGRRLRGAALRAKKRSTAAAEDIVQSNAVGVEEGVVSNKPNEELFVLDTTAVIPSKKQQEKKDQKLKKRKYQASAKEQAQIEKLIEKHPADELQKLIKKGNTTAKRAKIKGAVQPNFDLWGDDDEAHPSKQKKLKEEESSKTLSAFAAAAGIKPAAHPAKISSTKALPAPKGNSVSIDVAVSGQSYNPDKIEHKNAILEALRVETKREFAEKEATAPVSQGLSAETKELLLGDSDSEDESSDDERDDDDSASNERPIQKRPEKLTRAQRNKQKRLRAEAQEIRERKRRKKLQNAVNEAKFIARKLRKEETETKERKEKIEELKAEKERVKGKDVYQWVAEENPRQAPTFPVALPDELKSGSSLRTIRPKGSLITDRMVSLMDRDMAPKKALKKKQRAQGKRRQKIKVRGKGYEVTKEGEILG
jgi:nucleolar protein 53